jgi:26S proteasome non-ATPase regulatory subunit 9
MHSPHEICAELISLKHLSCSPLVDYKVLMKEIEQLLPQLYEPMSTEVMATSLISLVSSSTSTSGLSSSSGVPPIPDSAPMLVPFGKIDEVLAGSPAEAGGLQNGDLVLRFGSVTVDTPSPLGHIPALLRSAHDTGAAIELEVLRPPRQGDATVATFRTLQLRPQAWGGRGLLGCHLTPHSP